VLLLLLHLCHLRVLWHIISVDCKRHEGLLLVLALHCLSER
jgi:hypothetical protein